MISDKGNENYDTENSWFNRFSSYYKLVRVIGWIRRFWVNCKNKEDARKEYFLNSEEYSNAETILVKAIQKCHYSSLDDERIRHFLPFIDE